MGSSFLQTTSYSNLTILELEQLRKADFAAGGRALTIGDSASGAGNVGKGDITAERFPTGPSVLADDLQNILTPSRPGTVLQSQTFVSSPSTYDMPPDTIRWYGPTFVYSGTTGETGGASAWLDNNANFDNNIILSGDILLVGAKSAGPNNYKTGTITGVDDIANLFIDPAAPLVADGPAYPYVIVRAGATQLFALPGSGPTGQEQTFLMVDPYPATTTVATGAGGYTVVGTLVTITGGPNFGTNGTVIGDIFTTNSTDDLKFRITQLPPAGGLSNNQFRIHQPYASSGSTWHVYKSIHNLSAPTPDQINSVRLRDIVSPDLSYTSDPGLNRSDAVFPIPAPAASDDVLGYRPILYPDAGTGLGPDLGTPIANVNPVANAAIPSADQRMTIDYKAGVVRFSTAPTIGQIKVAGGVNPVTLRLNLYATFFAMSTASSRGTVKGLFNATTNANTPAKILWNATDNVWDVAPGFKVPLVSDPLLSAGSADALANIYDNNSWDFIPSFGYPGADWRRVADGDGSLHATYASGSGTFPPLQVTQKVFVPVIPGQVITFYIRYQRKVACLTAVNLLVVATFRNTANVTQVVPLTIGPLNTTDSAVQTFTGRIVAPAGYPFLTTIYMVASGSVSYPSGIDLFRVLEAQAFLHPPSLTGAATSVPVRNLVEGRLRITNGLPTASDSALFYATSPSRLVHGLVTPFQVESTANVPPAFDQRGSLILGQGLLSDDSARQTVYIPTSGLAGIRRTLISESKKVAGGHAACRVYARDATGFPQYSFFEVTINARWDNTSQLWVKDQGGGSGASRLLLSNGSMTISTHSGAASFIDSAWTDGPINASDLGTLASAGGSPYSISAGGIVNQVAQLLNRLNTHATASSSDHDGRYASAGHNHDSSYLKRAWSFTAEIGSGFNGIYTNQSLCDLILCRISKENEDTIVNSPFQRYASLYYHAASTPWFDIEIYQHKLGRDLYDTLAGLPADYTPLYAPPAGVNSGDIHMRNFNSVTVRVDVFGFNF